MAEMFDLNGLPASVDILDPGCGTGILSAALIDRLQRETNIKKIFLTCYETDPDVIPVLRSNLIYIKKNASISFDFEIKKDDYILSQGDSFSGTLHAEPYPPKYDLVIASCSSIDFSGVITYFLMSRRNRFHSLRDLGVVLRTPKECRMHLRIV